MKKQLKVSYKKTAKVSGYEIQVATNKKFTKNLKTIRVYGASKTSAVVNGLKGGKKYYVRVRTFRNINNNVSYSSAWSKLSSKTVNK